MRFQTNYLNLWSFALLLSIVISCKQSTSTDVTPADLSCQVQAINAVGVEFGTTFTTGTAFNYDAKGQLTSVVESNSNTTGNPTSRTTETYTYDNSGYQTAYKYVYTYPGYSDDTDNYTYEYTNGRLSKQTDQATTSYLQATYTGTYTYDAAGALTQLLSSTAGKITLGGITTAYTNSFTALYANGMLTVQKVLVNGKETATYTVENGRITTETSSDGTKTRYTYDAGGYQTKKELLTASGTVTSSTTTEYGATPAPKSVYPASKGFPVYQPYYGNNDRVVSRVSTTSGGKLSDDYQYQYQLNSKGYPTKATRKNAVINSTRTTTYTYANCQ